MRESSNRRTVTDTDSYAFFVQQKRQRGDDRGRAVIMKLLLIYGEQDAGKSTSCLRLYHTLKGLDATVEFYERFSWGDFKSVVTLNGSKIAIYSAGDEKQHLMNAIEFGQNQGCEVLVAVVRYKTHYNETLQELTCGEDFFWFTLDKGNDHNEMNRNESRMVMQLLDEIFKMIGL